MEAHGDGEDVMFRLYCEGQEDGLDLGPDMKLWQAFAEMELIEPDMADKYKALYAVPHQEDEISVDELDEVREEAETFIEAYGFKLGKHALWVLEQITGKVVDDTETKKMFGVGVMGESLKSVWRAPARKQFDAEDIDEIINVFEDSLTDAHEEALIKAYLLALTKRKEDVEEEIGIVIGFDVKSPRAIKYARDQAGDLISGINKTTKDRIREVLADGINEGKSMGDLADDIGGVFEVAKGPRAMSIARTETAEAMTWAAEESYKVAGVEKKEWLLAPDYNPAEDDGHCEEYDGEIVDIGEQFHDGVDGPPLHINCRCAIAPILAEEMEPEDLEDDEKGVGRVRVVYKSKYQTKEARMARASALGAVAAPVERNMRNRVIRVFQTQSNATLKRLRRF